MRLLQHFHILIPFSPLFTIIGAIRASSVRRSEAQLQPMGPRVKTNNPAASTITPSSLAPSSSTASGVTLEAIMEQL